MRVKAWSGTLAAVGVLALAVGACGSSSSSTTSAASSASASSSATSTAAPAAAPSVAFSGLESTVPSSYPQPKSKHLTLAYLNPEAPATSSRHPRGVMKLETQKLGGSFTRARRGGDVNSQVSQFNQLIAQKVQGIAVFALDPKSLAPDVARAKAAGIDLVTIDLDFANALGVGLGAIRARSPRPRQGAYRDRPRWPSPRAGAPSARST